MIKPDPPVVKKNITHRIISSHILIIIPKLDSLFEVNGNNVGTNVI